jgi:oxygen-independent coproporphyrinogen-3 oxidase
VARATVFDGYCRALVHEAQRLPEIHAAAGIDREVLGLPVDTLYVGGGTPTVLGAARLHEVLDAIGGAFRIEPRIEFTMEITPGSADESALRSLRELGVNRLSIGAQTFSDQELRVVGRLHTAAATEEMVAAARRAGFTNISLDVIAGLPYQTPESWRQTLAVVAGLRPEHVSLYIFEIDEKSRLGREVIRHGTRFHAEAVPDEDFAVAAYEQGRAHLRSGGYRQYEISNFALPGFESRHNRKYWRLEPYVGLGAGAHSFDGERRWANETSSDAYSEMVSRGESPITENHRLTADEQIEEFFFLGLRQAEGVNLSAARRRWGPVAVERWEPVVAALEERGLVERDGDQVRVAECAYLVSNEIFQEFLVAHEEV